MVDSRSNVSRIHRLGYFDCHMSCHIGEDVEISVAERMAEQRAIPLRYGAWPSCNMHHWNECNKAKLVPAVALSIESTPTPKAVTTPENPFDPGIAIGRLSSVLSESLSAFRISDVARTHSNTFDHRAVF